MAVDFMSLLGAMAQGAMAPSAGQRMQNAAFSMGGLGDMLSSLMGAGSSSQSSGQALGGLGDMLSGLFGSGGASSASGQSQGGGLFSMGQGMLDRAGKAAGGKDNLAAAGVGALMGALTGKGNAAAKGIGGGLMGLLGMMAYKALTDSGQQPAQPAQSQAYTQSSFAPNNQVNQNDDARILIIAMIDAAKADGKIDQNEFQKISNKVKEAGIGQEGMDYIIKLMQSPMSTDTIVAYVKGRPDMAVQVYLASLMAIEVDTKAERNYLDRLATAMGLTPATARNIEQLMSMK